MKPVIKKTKFYPSYYFYSPVSGWACSGEEVIECDWSPLGAYLKWAEALPAARRRKAEEAARLKKAIDIANGNDSGSYKAEREVPAYVLVKHPEADSRGQSWIDRMFNL
jgi:hypothetical protein